MKYKFITVRYVRFFVRNDSERVEYGIQNFISVFMQGFNIKKELKELQCKKGVKGLYMV